MRGGWILGAQIGGRIVGCVDEQERHREENEWKNEYQMQVQALPN